MNNNTDYQVILENFKNRVDEVNKLLTIDEVIIKTALYILEEKQKNLENLDIENAALIGLNAITQLKNIRDNKSLKPQYKLIHNQCVVLLVSYFTSSLHDLFNLAVTNHLIKRDIQKKIKTYDLKLTLGELKENDFDLSKNIGAIISSKFNISFQDMGSVSKALNNYLNVNIEIDKNIRNIITMQACRHAIAHAGELVDDKLLNQLRNSQDRDIQKDLKFGEKIQFTPEEINFGGEEMMNYVEMLITKVEAI